MIRAVVFDLDGVLIDSEEANIESKTRTFRKHGYEITDEDKKYIVGRSVLESVPAIVKRHGWPEDLIKKVTDDNHSKYVELTEKMSKTMPHAREVLHRLREKGIVLGLATTNTRESAERFFRKFDMGGIFKFKITRNDVRKRKPDPEIYNKAKQRLGLPGNEILAVEDTGIGVQAAKAAGLVCAAVPNQYTRNHDFSNADYVFDSLDGILSVV